MKTATIELDREWVAALRRAQFRAIGRTVIRYATATLACLSVLVMTSESSWFPWPNLAACGVLGLIVWRANK